MLPHNGIIPSHDECRDKNKSAFLKGFHSSCIYLHNIVTNHHSSKVQLYNREIDEETIEVLKCIINFGIEGGSSYSKLKIYCCRDIDKKVDLQSLKNNPMFKNIEIYRHPIKDIFHDRFLNVLIEEEQTEDIYLMGNSLSSIKKDKPLSIAQIVGKCIINLDSDTKDSLKNELEKIVRESKRIYPKEKL